MDPEKYADILPQDYNYTALTIDEEVRRKLIEDTKQKIRSQTYSRLHKQVEPR